ncbi:hypothetical protein RHSIM_Rhsim01G0142700 [Rhododendron simsii]|uniref:Zinc finger PMZ-type domain-containing protein n=1 Tax=Rhododendron simsii TaxID=118357 RepID=A0A834HHI5_RHOSS|nr:hypothetical protein RHSIM_Rhsim01G0142700 [Rhododendron simsii]
MPLEHLQQRVRKDIVVDISHTQAYMAKRKALDLIEGTNLEQFGMLRDYCEEKRRTNPNTSIVMKTVPSPSPDGQPIFERLYICLGALKKGMLAGCRRLICMDACHLKGAHGGQLLVAGLVPTLQTVVLNAEMRFCTRHLYTNFRDEHKGMELRKQLWATARATTVPDFQKAMDIMRSIDVEAYKWLAEKPTTQWSRSHFSTFNNCDILVNNLCEGFNKDIRKARDKPIITMLEAIRRWDLKGIPCVHAIVAITFNHENVLDYCHPCYGKETNASIYKGIIYPINGWTMWPSSGCVPVLPPNYGRYQLSSSSMNCLIHQLSYGLAMRCFIELPLVYCNGM